MIAPQPRIRRQQLPKVVATGFNLMALLVGMALITVGVFGFLELFDYLAGTPPIFRFPLLLLAFVGVSFLATTAAGGMLLRWSVRQIFDRAYLWVVRQQVRSRPCRSAALATRNRARWLHRASESSCPEFPPTERAAAERPPPRRVHFLPNFMRQRAISRGETNGH